jgi:hypothetical protein
MAVMIDQKSLLLHAERCRKYAAQCVDRDVAAKFIELARFYQTLAIDAESEPQSNPPSLPPGSPRSLDHAGIEARAP